MLHDVADIVATFDGSYRVGPDVGTGPEDMMVIRDVTPHSFCLPQEHGGTGNPSTPTALGVQAALRAGARHVFGSESLSGRRVEIAGFGSVGSRLAADLSAQGAMVIVSDVDDQKREGAKNAEYGWVDPDQALLTPADVLVPAAVGGVLNPRSVTALDVPIIIDSANNQVSSDSVAQLLAAAGTVWVPDLVTSAGGVIYVLSREVGGLGHDAAAARVEAIEETVNRVLDAARTAGTTPLHESMALAQRGSAPQPRSSRRIPAWAGVPSRGGRRLVTAGGDLTNRELTRHDEVSRRCVRALPPGPDRAARARRRSSRRRAAGDARRCRPRRPGGTFRCARALR